MPDPTLIPGWSPNRVALAGVALSILGAAVDASTGHGIVLMPLVALGPYCALLSGRWRLTGIAGLWAILLGVVLAVPDGIWDTRKQADYVGAIAVIAVVATAIAAVVERHPLQR